MNGRFFSKSVFLVLLLVCCFMLTMCAPKEQGGTETQGTSETTGESTQTTEKATVENMTLYWNVDRNKYLATDSFAGSSRPAQGGKYSVCFAVDGMQVTLVADDNDLINQIDFQYVMGLVLDENNEIKKVVPISECSGGVAVNFSYVVEASGNTVKCNTAASGKGIAFTLNVSDCAIYDVSVEGADCGKKTELQKGDKLYGIQNTEGKLTHLYVVERSNLSVDVTHTAHCICGGTGAYSHTCEEKSEWIAWGDDAAEVNKLPTESGNYYLVQDVKLSARHTFPAETEITICLNGKYITGKDRLFGVYGKLNIGDCQFTKTDDGISYKGTVDMSYEGPKASGGTFYVYDGCEVNVYGGNFVATAALSNGGILQTRAGGTFNLYGGKFSGGNVANKGGIINMMDGGTVNLYGGEITGGRAKLGDGICLTEGTLNISGNVKIHGNNATNIYLCAGKTVNVSNLTEDAVIGITLEGGEGVIGTAENEADVQKLYADAEGMKIVWDSTTKQISIVAE